MKRSVAFALVLAVTWLALGVQPGRGDEFPSQLEQPELIFAQAVAPRSWEESQAAMLAMPAILDGLACSDGSISDDQTYITIAWGPRKSGGTAPRLEVKSLDLFVNGGQTIEELLRGFSATSNVTYLGENTRMIWWAGIRPGDGTDELVFTYSYGEKDATWHVAVRASSPEERNAIVRALTAAVQAVRDVAGTSATDTGAEPAAPTVGEACTLN